MGLVALIERAGMRVGADRKVIKKDEAYVVADVQRIFDSAQEQVNAELRRAEQLCSQMAAEAYRDGTLRAQADAAARWTVAELDRMELIKSMQPALVEVIVDAVALLVKGLDRQAFFAQALEQLQSCLRDVSWARLRVHPQVAEEARAAVAELAGMAGVSIVHVIPDEALTLDACVLESEFGRIDASLDVQLAAIHDAIANAMSGESFVPVM